MGTGGSKEVVLPLPGAAVTSFDTGSGSAAATTAAESERRRHVAESAYREAEEALYREGYQHGVAETLAKVDDQVAKQARVAFADYAREEERARAVLVERNIAKLSEVQYRPPQHAPECVAEEAAVLVLDPRVHSKEHSNATTAYAHCANAVQSRLMNPAAAAMR